VAQALKAQEEGADYIGVGSIFPTSTKEDATVIGLETLRAISENVTIPIVAIGGINLNNITGVFTSGASSAAVISAVLNAPDVESATKKLAGKIEKEESVS
jgi:thiamine-phosphate pyrophosphorylase